MDAFQITRALIDIDSVTPHEERIGDWLFDHLRPLAERFNGRIEKIQVEPGRNNVWAWWGTPEIVFSTHMDTVPPFIPSKEDDEFIWGRGACDTHGLCAAMIKSIERLLEEGVRDLGLLLVVGEEVDGRGAAFANKTPPAGVRYLINGEPTENLLALGSKGALGLRLTAEGAAAHSAYEELGDSAIDKLLDNLQSLRSVIWPSDPILGETTLNIGTIQGGIAANVIPDQASATLMIRVVSDLAAIKAQALAAFDDRVGVEVVAYSPAVHLKAVDGFETSVVKYTTDIPKLTNWGQPLLLGPGTIHVAHTLDERVPKKQIAEAIELYVRLAKQLKTETKN
ncbi:MAG: M20/M25/M40 family metallo-hydrolase [Acidobacteria bacterium]|nr:M20/M25/M40 family metallo-hydrolase [Acidobacteriota bacterium]MDA1234158.1 M20/M25/M40 family metallo-hydrolase [Acidobacteriota bacterium]